jgi:hypothetical protein
MVGDESPSSVPYCGASTFLTVRTVLPNDDITIADIMHCPWNITHAFFGAEISPPKLGLHVVRFDNSKVKNVAHAGAHEQYPSREYCIQRQPNWT